MNPIKITRNLSKKAAWIMVGKTTFVAFGLYGMVAGFNNFTSFSSRSYEDFIVAQAKSRNIVQTKVEIQYVADPQKAVEAVSNAAAEGAKKGAQAQIDKALQGK